MDAFLRDLALVVTGAFVGPVILRLVRVPGRMRQLKRETERAWTDHEVWFARKERALLRELRIVDEELNARGLFRSGIRTQRRADVLEKYQDALEDNWRETIRRMEDAGTFVGWPERLYFKWRMEDRTSPSVESQLIRGAKELAERHLNDERQRLTATETRE